MSTLLPISEECGRISHVGKVEGTVALQPCDATVEVAIRNMKITTKDRKIKYQNEKLENMAQKDRPEMVQWADACRLRRSTEGQKGERIYLYICSTMSF